MNFKDIRKFSDILSAHVVYSTYYPINAFYAFYQSEFATENFEFLLLARAFHPALGPAAYDFFPANIATPADRARYIYLTHIKEDAPSAPKMVNINSDNRLALLTAYGRDDWQADSFDAAHEEIARLLDYDTFSRFQNWPGNDAMPGINIQASRAARAARATHYNLPAHPAPATVPAVAAPAISAPLPQIQMAAQPAQGFHPQLCQAANSHSVLVRPYPRFLLLLPCLWSSWLRRRPSLIEQEKSSGISRNRYYAREMARHSLSDGRSRQLPRFRRCPQACLLKRNLCHQCRCFLIDRPLPSRLQASLSE